MGTILSGGYSIEIRKDVEYLLVFMFLFFLFFNLCPSYSSSPIEPSPLCDAHESSALLEFKNSIPVAKNPFCLEGNSSVSWDMKRDCCSWSGVTCDEETGHVIGLQLWCGGLRGVIGSNNSLFSLTRIRTLNLSRNDFSGSEISPNFGRFPSLTHLDLSLCSFSGHVPRELAYLSNLLTLDLKWNYELRVETSSLKRIVSNLTALTELRLYRVKMSNVLPNSLMNLSTSLTNLDLRFSGLKGQFPENVFRLPNLKVLRLSYNPGLNGSFPQQNWTSPLTTLGLSETGFLIDLPFLTRNLKNLNALAVGNCSFININSNDLGGQIPWVSLLNLEKLTYFDLSHNNVKGQLAEICNNSASSSTEKAFLCDSSNHQFLGPLPLNLEYLFLENNFLNGTIPSWLYSLPSLHFLYLGSNRFTGQIGEFQCNSLRIIDLNSNKLHGPIPRSLFQLENLWWLDFSSNNLSGVVMLEQFSKLRNLEDLRLSFNSLSVISTPHTNYTLPHTLKYLFLSSCNMTEFPYSLRSLESLQLLDLSNNRIEGSVPKWLWNVGKYSLFFLNMSHNFLTHMGPIFPWKSLEYIDLRSNRVQGRLPILPSSVRVFFASDNQLSGGISSVICNQSSLEILDLSNNSLRGNILPCLGYFSGSLSVLDLRMNKFDGIIPSAFAKGSSLATLNLNGNQLEGPLPQSLLNSKSLKVLDVGNNNLNGSFPQFLESLPDLRVLVLRSNRFHGTIMEPKIRFPFRNLRIMDLSDNRFTGVLPSKYFENFKAMIGAHTNKLEYLEYFSKNVTSYYRDSVMVSMKGIDIELERIQTMFITIDFSRNEFTGGIPKSIGKLSSLKGLNFSHNKLTGPIPNSLGNLSNLEWLDLSSNEIVGKIPQKLASNLNQLGFLNLSGNKLEGPVPRGRQFDTFSNDSYEGNLGLCGFPLTKSCSEDKDDEQEVEDDEHGNGGLSLKLVVMMGVGAGLVIGVSIGYVVFFSRRFDRWLDERIADRRRERRRHCKSLAEIIKQRK